MALQTRYLFTASMDVEPSKEALFNEVYDTEHVPMLLTVPGVIAVARLSKLPGGTEAEFALLVSDQYQNRGLGTELLRRLIQVARDEKLVRLGADVLAENREMQRLCEKLGFTIQRELGEPTVRAELELL